MYASDFRDLATAMHLLDMQSPFHAHRTLGSSIADALLDGEPLVLRKRSALSPRGNATGNRPATPRFSGDKPAGAPSTTVARRRRAINPAFEWEATQDGVVLTASTPGLKKEELDVQILCENNHRYLVVSGETKDSVAATNEANPAGKEAPSEGSTVAETASTEPKGLGQRFYYEKFEHRMQLPEGVTSDCLKAQYADGMLTLHLTLPKEKPAQTETIKIA